MGIGGAVFTFNLSITFVWFFYFCFTTHSPLRFIKFFSFRFGFSDYFHFLQIESLNGDVFAFLLPYVLRFLWPLYYYSFLTQRTTMSPSAYSFTDLSQTTQRNQQNWLIYALHSLHRSIQEFKISFTFCFIYFLFGTTKTKANLILEKYDEFNAKHRTRKTRTQRFQKHQNN